MDANINSLRCDRSYRMDGISGPEWFPHYAIDSSLSRYYLFHVRIIFAGLGSTGLSRIFSHASAMLHLNVFNFEDDACAPTRLEFRGGVASVSFCLSIFLRLQSAASHGPMEYSITPFLFFFAASPSWNSKRERDADDAVWLVRM